MPHKLILGGPGCGKTTRLLSIMEQELARGVRPERLAFVSFTRKAVGEAQTRACEKFSLSPRELPYFRTIHSLAYRLLGVTKGELMEHKHWAELGAALGYDFSRVVTMDEGGLPTGRERGDLLRFLDGVARARCVSAEEQLRDSREEVTPQEFARYRTTLLSYKRDTGQMDFTDLLERYCADGASCPVDVVIIDEAQDLSRLQWRLIKRAFAGVQRTYVAGDDDQCQPRGTVVETTSGPCPIEELREDRDRVLAYSRSDASVYGKRTGGYAFKKAQRQYTGIMYTIRAGEKKTRCTDNHRWLVKWRPEAKTRGLCCTYLMKRGDWWRVGWCQLFREDGCFHLNVRASGEKADAVWLLNVHDSRTDASIEESVFAARYGIPTMPFEPVNGARHITTDAINRVFSSVDSRSGAVRLLRDARRNPRYPFIDRLTSNYSRYGSTILDVRACNLLNDMMLVPVYSGTKAPLWEPFQLEAEPVFDATVFSLAVDKYETYIADGIITHNCIFKWSGADVDTFLSLRGEREILSTTHRLPRHIYGYSQMIVSRLSRRFEKKATPRDAPGALQRLNSWEQAPIESGGTWMLLARNTFYLTQLKGWLHEAGLPYATHGRSSVNPEHLRAISAWEKLRKGEAVPAQQVRDAYEYLEVKRGHKTLPGVADDAPLTLADLRARHGCSTDAPWHDALGKIPLRDRTYYRAVKRRGESLTKAPRVYVGTIHCSPPDELVLTTTGWKAIGEIDHQADRLISYNDACNAVVCGRNSDGRSVLGRRDGAGYSFLKSVTHYSGPLLTLKTARSRTRVTPEHRVRIRFNDAFYGRWLVYLMRRGDWWRVGLCTTAHKPYKSGGVGGRLATEQADAGWILSIHDTREEALIAESIVQGLYGMPQLTFESAKNRALSRAALHHVHASTAAAVNGRILNLFEDFGLFVDAPLYTRGGAKNTFAGYWFDTVAANTQALSGRIALPVADVRPATGTWSPDKCSATVIRENYDGPVVSLEVAPHHYYVSGGAVVHNSVKGGEADNVLLIPNLTQRTWEGYERDRDDEHRTFYVGATRAKQQLFLVAPTSTRSYQL